MVVPPPRDVPGDLYADARSIPYVDGRMTCDGVVWQYRIYHPSSPPTHQFGTIGDIAYVLNDDGDNNWSTDNRVWYRGAKDWIVADATLGAHDIPKQKHPLLKGKYRLDGRTRRWRGATTYYYLGAVEKKKKSLREEKEKEKKEKKERQGDLDVDRDVNVDGPEETGEAVKVEPSESHLLAAHEERDNGSRQTGWIDLSNTPESEQTPSAYSFSAPAATRSGLKLIPISYEAATTRGQVVPSSILQPLEGQGPPHSASSTTTLHPLPGDERSMLGGPLLQELEGMNFHYPTFSGLGLGLGLGLAGSSILPPPRSIRECGVQTDGLVSEVSVRGQDPFGGMTFGVPMTPTSPMLVHHSDKMNITRPPSVQNAVSLSSSSSSTSTTTIHPHSHANQQLESSSITDSDSASDAFQSQSQSRRVESLLERILLESAKDRKDILGVIRTMNERLEAIERQRTQIQLSEGLTVIQSSSTSPLAMASSPVELVGASRGLNVPTTTGSSTTLAPATPTMTQAAVPVPTSIMAASGYVRPSLPLPKRYLKECRARKLGEDAVSGSSGTVTANAGVNMTMTKRKVPDESGSGEILEDADGVQEGVVKKTRFSARS